MSEAITHYQALPSSPAAALEAAQASGNTRVAEMLRCGVGLDPHSGAFKPDLHLAEQLYW